MAVIEAVSVEFSDTDDPKIRTFQIVSSGEEREETGSTIPADIAICNNCLAELHNPDDRRYDYFYITCTDCGPRFSIIDRLPYDRQNTSMVDFPPCRECAAEYRDPANRRFHAQTVACPKCGPKVFLTGADGSTIETKDSIRESGKLISDGCVVAVKGVGGFHLAASALLTNPLEKLRRSKKRRQKPFAIMARDLNAVRTFARVTASEEELLTSYHRPIVLLDQNRDRYLSEQVAPGLYNIGVMLPYTGLHVILFDSTNEPAFVLTSGNPPNEPVVSDNDEAIKKLSDVAEYFLMHNRRIINRCDDSVARIVAGSLAVVRRSRGYSPTPIILRTEVAKTALGTGAELNASPCLVMGRRAFLAQHIGDLETAATANFHGEALSKLQHLVGGNIEAVGCDLHPKFNSTRIAEKIAEQNGTRVTKVQHHYAHIRSLMAEHGLNEIIGISCDGFGYGADGTAWGGEILLCDENGYERVGHLQPQPMIGGDLATIYPLRMVAGILRDEAEIGDWLIRRQHLFPHGEEEVKLVLRQLRKQDFVYTSSCGRILDTTSALLGICHMRTYEGEPAMKLEAAAITGKYVLQVRPEILGKTLLTTPLIREVFMRRHENRIGDLAFSTQEYLARGLAELAIEKATQHGVRDIGFSGGVAYNNHIITTAKEIVRGEGYNFFLHKEVPPGDEGIALGQALVAAESLE